jgi:diadenosine tetraphosphate (Ap4A) HIT family hydrolase
MSSVFLERPEEWTASNGFAFLLPSYFEASPGHSLVVPRRVVPTIFDLSNLEMEQMWTLVKFGRAKIQKELQPDGFNIGVNCGEAAGQTVMHAHIHIIPRYVGDVPDPRGGVRLCIPEKGNYLT